MSPSCCWRKASAHWPRWPARQTRLAWPGCACLPVQSRQPVEQAWDLLWPASLERLQQIGVQAAAAIPLKGWFKSLVIEYGFTLEHNVVVLAWENDLAGDLPPAQPLTIRRMLAEHLPQVHEVDQQAFGLLWRNSLESLRLAHKQAIFATVALEGDRCHRLPDQHTQPAGGAPGPPGGAAPCTAARGRLRPGARPAAALQRPAPQPPDGEHPGHQPALAGVI